MYFRWLTIALTMFVFCMALIGCGPKERAADRAARENILLIGNGTEPRGLDPHLSTGMPENRIISALMEGLIAFHPTDDELPEPGVAERWEHSDNYSKWTFFLRQTARWSNGDPVTASDFVYSWRRILTPELGAEYASMLYVLKNAEQYHHGEIADFGRVGVDAIDERTLQVSLVGPTPYFLQMLKHHAWFPVHPPTIERFGGITSRGSDWTLPENYVGNGPFRLERWDVHRVVEVVKSETYWDASVVRLQGVHFLPIESLATEESAFLNGQLHLTSSLSSDKIAHYRRNRSEILRTEPLLGTYYYMLNVSRAAFQDPRVRKALALAIDRKTLVERVTQGGQVPSHGFTPPLFSGYETPKRVSFDPDEARRLLAEAGFGAGTAFPRIEILYNTLDDHKNIAEAIQHMWREHLGIQVSLTNQEWKVYLDSQNRRAFDVARAGWIADYIDPITMLDLWTSTNGNNHTGWANERFDRLIQEARRSATPEEHMALLREAEEILLSELPIIPLYWYNRVYLADPRVRGWNPMLLDNRAYKFIWIESSS